MEGLERIHELMDQIATEVASLWGDSVKARIILEDDGYQSFSVERWKKDEDLPIEAWKRRELLDQHRIGGEWSRDRSCDQNDHYRLHKVLLEEG
jgi:hypothetical protein